MEQERQSYKDREADKLKADKLKADIETVIRRVRNLPIFESDKGQIVVGLTFWCDEAIQKLQAAGSWVDSAIPPVSVDEAAATRIKKEQKEELERLEEQLHV